MYNGASDLNESDPKESENSTPASGSHKVNSLMAPIEYHFLAITIDIRVCAARTKHENNE